VACRLDCSTGGFVFSIFDIYPRGESIYRLETPSTFRAIDMNPFNETVRIGRHTMRNRLVMAPMTRSRADGKTGVPSALAAQIDARPSGLFTAIAQEACAPATSPFTDNPILEYQHDRH
jgi:NADH:flavin oxidoreductase / NADH oxidase family